MPPNPAPYIQRLAGSDLTIEKGTERTPDRFRYHVMRGGAIVASYRGLPQAQALFRQLRDELGWRPPPVEAFSPEERMRREKAAQDRLDYLEYWGSSHKFKGAGRPKRRQR